MWRSISAFLMLRCHSRLAGTPFVVCENTTTHNRTPRFTLSIQTITNRHDEDLNSICVPPMIHDEEHVAAVRGTYAQRRRLSHEQPPTHCYAINTAIWCLSTTPRHQLLS